MKDTDFLKGVAYCCEELCKAAAHTATDIGILNETMLELEKRASAAGLTRKDLYPNTK